jgi:CRP/FNR family transcriptional regulator, cyclic AMP receptor protein
MLGRTEMSGFTREHLDTFRSAYLFRGLEPSELSFFIDAANFTEWKPNDIVIREDDQGESLYLILSGKVRVTKRTFDGIEQVLGILGPGDFFGEMVLLDSRSRSASVYAHTRLELADIPHSDITRILSGNPRIGLNVLRSFAEVLSLRLREANDKLRSLPFMERTF